MTQQAEEQEVGTGAEQEIPLDFPYTVVKMAELLRKNEVRVRGHFVGADGKPAIEFYGGDEEGWRVANIIRDYDFLGFYLRRTWSFTDIPYTECHPLWALVFPKITPLGE